MLHEACIKNMQNERKLSEKISQLKKVSCLRIESRKSNCFSHLCIAIVKWDTEVGEGWVAEDRPQVQASDPSREMGGCEEGYLGCWWAHSSAFNWDPPALYQGWADSARFWICQVEKDWRDRTSYRGKRRLDRQTQGGTWTRRSCHQKDHRGQR